MEQLKSMIRECTRCPLSNDMPDGCCPVPGVGPVDAKLMLIGEALGEQESIMEEPFVGRAGELLNKLLRDTGIERSQIYISNAVKCRPTKEKKSNRPPSQKEINSCKLWLWKELTAINPSVIITLGRVSSRLLLKHKVSTKMKDIVGNVFSVDYIDSFLIPTYHPSYLLQHGRDKIELTKTHLIKAKELL